MRACRKLCKLTCSVILVMTGAVFFTIGGLYYSPYLRAQYMEYRSELVVRHVLATDVPVSDMTRRLMRLTELPIVLALIAGYEKDVRRQVYLALRDSVQGSKYAAFRNGIAVIPWAEVSANMMSPTQQRGDFFASIPLGPGAGEIPDECIPVGLILFRSTGDLYHSKFQSLFHRVMQGLRVSPKDVHELLLPPGLKPQTATNWDIQEIVGMNVYARLMGVEEAGWNQDLVALFKEYSLKGTACAIGISSAMQHRVNEILLEVQEHIAGTPAGERLKCLAMEEFIDPRVLLRHVAFLFMFAGMEGTSHLSNHIIGRIRADPANMLPLWRNNSHSFLLEQARINPPVTSYTSMLQNELSVNLSGYDITLPSNTTTMQNLIITANRDPAVFGLNAELFDPTRENLDKILSWNGIEGQFASKKAPPRGCPGHDLSQVVVHQVVEYFFPNDDIELDTTLHS
jgi:hypothetical protein